MSTSVKTPIGERLGYLVHEARHSDCTGGISSDDLERIQLRQPIKNLACGHSHSVCPVGHPLAGTFNCEDHPWGAYAVQFMFLDVFANHCTNCSKDDQVAVKDLLQDTLSRILISDALFSGKYGDPDMANGGPPWNP